MKKLFTLILVILIAVSCAAQRQYISSYQNVSILDNGKGECAYYPRVHVQEYQVSDSLSTISFTDNSGYQYFITGKNIIVENVILEGYNNQYRYIYLESSPRILYPYTYYSSNWKYYNPRPIPIYHHPRPYRPSHHNTRPHNHRDRR